MEITKREIIASVSILAIMLILGFVISNKIQEFQQDEIATYNKALKIKDTEIFKHSMKTNVGNAFVEGELKALDPVSYEDVEGEYLHIEREQEEYVMKTRVETYSTGKGKTATRVVTYWEWDTISRDEKTSKTVNFLGVNFDTSKFQIPGTSHIDTVSDGHNLRSNYYGYEKNSKVTVYSDLRNNTIKDNSNTYTEGMTSLVDRLTTINTPIFFWVIWLVFTALIIYAFYYYDNDWLY